MTLSNSRANYVVEQLHERAGPSPAMLTDLIANKNIHTFPEKETEPFQVI